MQELCNTEENENACRTKAGCAGPKKRRRQGVKKDDTVEKRATGGRKYKVQGSRKSEIRSTRLRTEATAGQAKSETSPKLKRPKFQTKLDRSTDVSLFWSFGFWFLNLFRISNFEIRIWTSEKPA